MRMSLRFAGFVGLVCGVTGWIGVAAVGRLPGWARAIGGAGVVEAAGGDVQKRLATALSEGQVTLAQGLAASRRQGAPISGKYELEEGKLQLSVYTEKNGKFSEVIVDHKTGTIAKTEPITHGDDLAAAKAQDAAVRKAKRSLETVASEAARQNSGFRVVSVTPGLKDGHPVAEVTLAKDAEWKTVSEKLD